ncbi:hypothetical protein B5K11_11725 [Rhizobium leguminosarum bv. trifolii]|uniref:hypothetical protein n=1 Tax=Rhizobium leguminosarum TaxID=384 RepID=UPI000E2F0603|nr:hypothetical protein [Rhizobium leguminosarum]RFB95572.1 hypothetical protein B5K11_11725 [Rhizobium leguminosarum bv. trifolii]
MMPELIESKSDFAKRLNLSKAYISKFAKSGLPCNEAGMVRVNAAIKWIRENVNAGPGRPTGSIERGESGDLAIAKTRLVLAQAARAEMELANLERTHMPAEEARRAVRTLMRIHRDHMLNFASRHGPAMAAELGIAPALLISLLEAKMREAIDAAANSMLLPFGMPNTN